MRQAKTTQGVANWDIIGKVKNAVSIPVVANGGVETLRDAEQLLQATGADAVMSSEGLLEDPSLFDKTLIPMYELQGVEVRCLLPLVALKVVEPEMQLLYSSTNQIVGGGGGEGVILICCLP